MLTNLANRPILINQSSPRKTLQSWRMIIGNRILELKLLRTFELQFNARPNRTPIVPQQVACRVINFSVATGK